MSKHVGTPHVTAHLSKYAKACKTALCALLLVASGLHARTINLPPAVVDLAGNRLDTLTLKASAKPADGDIGCTDDKTFCLQLLPQNHDSPPSIEVINSGANPTIHRFALEATQGEASNFRLWPRIVRRVGDSEILVGVEYDYSTAYSGGGGSASELHLLRIVQNGLQSQSQEMLIVPVAGHLIIRACFSEEDMRRRLGACHDEYAFTASLGLDRTVDSGFPRLVYVTRATSFPGKVSRDQDSLQAPPLRKRDLV